MRGHFSDLWAAYPYVAKATDQPQDRYLFDLPLTMPWLSLAQGSNQGADLANTRYVPFALVNTAQPPQTFMQNHEPGVFDTGGLAVIPFAGIWRVVK
jgi:hypothetical protein